MITTAMPVNYNVKVASIMPTSSESASTNLHPIATVFPGVANPIDYLAANTSSVIGGANDSDTSVSTSLLMSFVGAVIDSVDAPAQLVPPEPDDVLALLSVPHLFWRASIAVSDVA
jgi:hypothetical protein